MTDFSVPARLTGVAARLARGVCRAFEDHGSVCLTEFVLADGRRADVMAMDGRGRFTIVEVKSSPGDFRSDDKWHAYRAYCDAFYFAVSAEFPREMLPADCGLFVADAYGSALERAAPIHPLAPARRKALTLRFAQVAARRLSGVQDPR